MVYSDALEDKIDVIMDALACSYPTLENPRWHAIKLLEKDESVTAAFPLPDFEKIIDRSYEQEIINQKYDFIEEIIQEILVNKSEKEAFTEKLDHFLTHRIWGLPLFLGIMALVFLLTFTVGDWLKGYFEIFLESFSAAVTSGLTSLHVGDMMISLVVDGIISGVGGILTFLPNIFILFLALAFGRQRLHGSCRLRHG